MSLRTAIIASFSCLLPISAQAASHCIAICEFYSTHTDVDMTDEYERVTLVEKVPVNQYGYTELAKYRRDMESDGANAADAYHNMQIRCLDTAAARSEAFISGYTPKIIDSLSLKETTAEQVCTE